MRNANNTEKDAAIRLIKFRRRKRILLRNTLFVFLSYALTQALTALAKLGGLTSIAYADIILIAAVSMSITLAFLIIVSARKTWISLRFANTVFYGQYLIWAALYFFWVTRLNEIRIAGLFFAILALTFTLSNANFLQSLGIALAATFVQVLATCYAILVLDQPGSFFMEIFYTLCFLPAALFIAYLADQFQRQRDEIKTAKRGAERARDALWGEMRLAEKIQTVLLPHEPAVPGYAVSAFMKPAEEVGGDYYDIINTEPASWVIVGDVSGHGVSAGIIMMMAESIIQAVVRDRPAIPPAELLRLVNRSITYNIRQMDEENYMTIVAMAVGTDGAVVHAGLHLDILVYRAGTQSVETIQTSGMWLGIRSDIERFLTDNAFIVHRDDVILLYTDGVVEAKDVLGNQFGAGNLARILRENGHAAPDAIHDAIIASLSLYRPDDDVTLVLLKKL